ncbi:MAG TPA: hypothetical protein VHY22_08065 [Chthoniobacteraceae bacterium]|jgi:hypothetical protein|nr:hypothetical protein [Chthoniobacteraceae bacterium]
MHKDLPAHISPFIATSFNPIDPEKFHADRETRFTYLGKFWDVLQNCRAYYKNEDWRRFHQQMEILNPKFTSTGPAVNRDQLFRYYRNFGKPFTPFSEPQRELLEERLGRAESTSAKLCYELRRWLHEIGWYDLLESQFFAIKESWVAVFYMISPVYMPLYWDSSKNKLAEYQLAQKRFGDLKPFYIDVFESLARISVISVGIEGILRNGELKYPAKKGDKRLEDFKKMDNGSKWDVLRNMVIGDCFSELSSSRLRNGIGHNAAHYDVAKDSIEYRNESKNAASVTGEILYTQFCAKLLALYQQWEVASIYIWWLCAFDVENVRRAVEGAADSAT